RQHRSVIVGDGEPAWSQQKVALVGQSRPLSVNPAALDAFANDHHGESTAMIRATGNVLINTPTELGHNNCGDTTSAGAKILIECSKAASQLIHAIGLNAAG